METQRFEVRRGWLRNRRAVVASPEGLTIERWWGRPRCIAWQQIITATWADAELLVVRWAHGVERFGVSTCGLDRLAHAVESATARLPAKGATALALSPDDLLRALDGYHREALAYDRGRGLMDLDGAQRVVMLIAVGLVGIGTLAFRFWWLLEHGAPADDRLAEASLLGPPAVALAGVLVVADCAVRWATHHASCAVCADRAGVRVSRASGDREFTWQQARSLRRKSGNWVVDLGSQPEVSFPDDPKFAPVLRALRLAIESRRARVHLDRPASDAALSLADEHLDTVDADRGLSRAEEVDA